MGNRNSTMNQETMISFKRVLITALCFVLLSVFSNSMADSSKDKAAEITMINEDDRRLLLTSISENAMLPIFKGLRLSSLTLYEKTQFFCANKTDDSLIDLRRAWLGTASAWQQADSLLFGPTVDDNIDFAVYFLPIKKGIIKTLLIKDELLLKDVDSAGVGAQGLGSLEYLLFSRELSLLDIQQSFANDPKRCNYLLRTTELLHENISTIAKQWEHYGVQFGLAGNSSLYFFESEEAMILLINKIYQSAQKISNKKIGLLDSKRKIKKSTSYKLQAWRSGSSLEQVKANTMGINRILAEGKVLEWLKNQDKAKAAKEISQVIEEILNFKVVDTDLFEVLQKSPDSLQILVKNTQKLTELIKTELAPSLGVDLGFNSNDGD